MTRFYYKIVNNVFLQASNPIPETIPLSYKPVFPSDPHGGAADLTQAITTSTTTFNFLYQTLSTDRVGLSLTV